MSGISYCTLLYICGLFVVEMIMLTSCYNLFCIFLNLFRAQSQFLTMASQCKAPSNQSDIMKLLEPTSVEIIAVMDFFEKHRGSPHFNHLNAVSSSISALSWVTVVSVSYLL